jgi:radical SAM superfamily enzyme YgiQ (UPF0313 family)
MSLSHSKGDDPRSRLASEKVIAPWSDSPKRCALLYPSSYHVGMSSLGFQQIWRSILACENWTPLRAFNDADESGRPFAYELAREMPDVDALAFSVAYELEIAGMIEMLDRMKLEPLRRDRQPGDAPVIAGGPLTFSNPAPLLPFVDVLICGEGEGLIGEVLQRIEGASKHDFAMLLDDLDGVVVPGEGNPFMLPVAKADNRLLPARSAIVAEHTVLRKMFLIEPERGCSRQCSYCVMRRSTNGGMRPVAAQDMLDAVPPGVERVGLVGAAVTDHRDIVAIVNELADRGLQVGISSLRADRLKRPLLEALFAGGYRGITVALDGASPRLRRVIHRKTEDLHIERVAHEAKAIGFMKMKVYMVLGLPTESDEDLHILALELIELSKILPIDVGLCPLVPKRNTPLYCAPFIGVKESDRRLKLLRKLLKGRVNIRPVSSRWSWVESVLARGGVAVGEAVLRAHRAGGGFAAYRRAFAELGYFPDGRVGADHAPMGVDGGVAFGLHGAEQMLATNTAIKQLRKR